MEGESLEINIWDKWDKKPIGKLLSKSDRFLGCARITPKLIEKFIDAGGMTTNFRCLYLFIFIEVLFANEI